ncbi:PRC-barrel domain-containing protein [Flexithrix dorotheae]|uniref:PRC-barrel domain-containing protein n=1 Tax=Flexithrix dorotheae TaxID=70993 RepID=UPI00036291CB|nr:PRC-barrel domain-containing protein [Flexithrix dorotheae]
MTPYKFTKANVLKDTKVYSPQNQLLGTVNEVVIDNTTGRIAYVVMEYSEENFNKLFAIPWQVFAWDMVSEGKAILDVSKEKIKNAPGFNKTQWPDYPQEEFLNQVYVYYNSDPAFNPINDPVYKTKNAGLDNSGEAKTIEEAGFDSNKIERTGMSRNTAREKWLSTN